MCISYVPLCLIINIINQYQFRNDVDSTHDRNKLLNNYNNYISYFLVFDYK